MHRGERCREGGREESTSKVYAEARVRFCILDSLPPYLASVVLSFPRGGGGVRVLGVGSFLRGEGKRRRIEQPPEFEAEGGREGGREEGVGGWWVLDEWAIFLFLSSSLSPLLLPSLSSPC